MHWAGLTVDPHTVRHGHCLVLSQWLRVTRPLWKGSLATLLEDRPVRVIHRPWPLMSIHGLEAIRDTLRVQPSTRPLVTVKPMDSPEGGLALRRQQKRRSCELRSDTRLQPLCDNYFKPTNQLSSTSSQHRSTTAVVNTTVLRALMTCYKVIKVTFQKGSTKHRKAVKAILSA